MKNTKTWVKVLLLAFCLVFVFSSLIACGTDEELAKLQSQIDELKNKGDETATDLDADKAAKEAAIAELRTLIDAVKKTADAAATAAKLEEVVTALETADDANAKALADAEAAIKALINDNATADATTKEALEKADAEIKALAEAAATKTEFNEAVKTLNDTLATKKALEEADAALKKLIADGDAEAAKKLDELKKTVEEDVAKKIDEVQKAIAANGENDAKVQAALEAADKAITDKVTALEGTMTEVQKTLTALGEKDADLQNQINTLNATLATKADAEEVNKAIAEINKQIEEEIMVAIADLKINVANFKTDIYKQVEELKAQQGELVTKVDSLGTKVEGIELALQALTETVKNLDTAIKNPEFVKNYTEATNVLAGKIEELSDYSLAAFDKLFAGINEKIYTKDIYAEFKTNYETLKFFLNRALSVEDIKSYFADMEALIKELPTLLQSLEAEITRIETEKAVNLVVDEDGDNCIAVLEEIKELMDTNGVALGALETRYNTIVAAYGNLVAAEKASADVEAAIEDVVVDATYGLMYKRSDESLMTARAAVKCFGETYFANEEYLALYSASCDEGKELIANWNTYNGYEARFSQLLYAASIKPKLPDCVVNYAENKPMWFDYAALEELMKAISAWRFEKVDNVYNNIDSLNYTLIYENYADIDAAYAYAKYMNFEVYENLKVAELIKNIQELCAQPDVLYSNFEDATSYRNQITEVQKAIATYADWDALSDHNDDKMLSYELLKSFADVEAVMSALDVAATTIKGYIAEMEAVKGKIDFGHSDDIQKWYDQVVVACKDAEIELDETDANYVTVRAQEALALNAELLAEYNVLTAQIAEVYKAIEEKFGDGTWELKDGKYVVEVSNYFADLVNEYGIDRINIDLTLNYPDGTSVQGNLRDIYFQWNEIVTDYYDFADKAVEAAVDVNDAIAGIATLATNNLNNYAAIEKAWNQFAAWTLEYLHIDTTKATWAELEAAYAEIADITAIGGENSGKVYAFVTGANAKTVYDSYVAVVAHNEASVKAWETVSAELAALTGDKWNIHSDFVTPNTNYATYLTTYYAGAITTANEGKGMNDEVAAFVDFSTAETAYDGAYAAAETLAKKITAAIDALDAIANYVELEKAIAAIEADIALYNATYKCSAETTDFLACRAEEWSVTDAQVLAFQKNKTRAAYEKICDAFINKYSLTADTIVTTAQIANVINNAKNTLDQNNDASKLENIVKVVNDQIKGYEEMIEAYAECEKKYNEFQTKYAAELAADTAFAEALADAFATAEAECTSSRPSVRETAVANFTAALEALVAQYVA